MDLLEPTKENILFWKNSKDMMAKRVKELKSDLEKQCKQTKEFGDKLLIFQKKKENIMYEKKIKQYRDEIIGLKSQLQSRIKYSNKLENKLYPRKKGEPVIQAISASNSKKEHYQIGLRSPNPKTTEVEK